MEALCSPHSWALGEYMTSKHELEQNINIAFGHFPFMLKRASVDIIHFLEMFWKYDLINQQTDVGFSDQVKWESLIDTYLEKSHSYIDKQRKVFANVTEELNIDLSSERDSIVLPISIEHKAYRNCVI